RDADRGKQPHRSNDAARDRSDSREEENLAGCASGLSVAGELGQHRNRLRGKIYGQRKQRGGGDADRERKVEIREKPVKKSRFERKRYSIERGGDHEISRQDDSCS